MQDAYNKNKSNNLVSLTNLNIHLGYEKIIYIQWRN